MLALTLVATSCTWAAVRKIVLGTRAELLRTNYAGRVVDLSGGIAVTAGLVAASFAQPTIGKKLSTALFCGGSGILGAIDDGSLPAPKWVSDDRSVKGLRGHVNAVARGEFTTGFLKLAGIPALALASEALCEVIDNTQKLHVSSFLMRTVAMAGTTNLLNLLDLRPGRALKVGGVLLTVSALAADNQRRSATVGVATVVLSIVDDLREITMLGDCGANSLGAYIGTCLARSSAIAAGLTAVISSILIVSSEKISFTYVIDSVELLRKLDRLGAMPR